MNLRFASCPLNISIYKSRHLNRLKAQDAKCIFSQIGEISTIKFEM